MMNPIEYLEVRLNIISSVTIEVAMAVQSLAIMQGDKESAHGIATVLRQAELATEELVKKAQEDTTSKLVLVKS